MAEAFVKLISLRGVTDPVHRRLTIVVWLLAAFLTVSAATTTLVMILLFRHIPG